MQNKAIPKGFFTTRDGNHTFLAGCFEYRGHEYFVEYRGWYAASDSEPWMQHKSEQARIDKLIEYDETPSSGRPAQEGFDLFWKYVEGED